MLPLPEESGARVRNVQGSLCKRQRQEGGGGDWQDPIDEHLSPRCFWKRPGSNDGAIFCLTMAQGGFSPVKLSAFKVWSYIYLTGVGIEVSLAIAEREPRVPVQEITCQNQEIFLEIKKKRTSWANGVDLSLCLGKVAHQSKCLFL